MGVTGSLSKIGAVFFAAVSFAVVAPSKSAYAQTRNVGSFGRSAGSFLGFPFGFRGGFGRQNFGTNIVVVPSAGLTAPYYGVPPPDYGVPPAPYYGVSPPGYDSLRCYLHRHVDTPNGPILQPVYVC